MSLRRGRSSSSDVILEQYPTLRLSDQAFDTPQRLVSGLTDLSAIWKDMGNGERSRPTGFQFAREHLQSRVKEEDLITDVENAVFDL
ncbi:hypothetical protein Tco_0570122 [Tanacetum coccineum]